MYTTKIPSNKDAVEMGEREAHHKYITIGDPYVDPNRKLPERWKKPQFQIDRRPKNAGNGFFGYNGASFTYAPDAYKETRKYSAEQPPDKRMNGFGTRDASKRDEFAATIRTEQYRETLKRENIILDSQRDKAKEEALLEKLRTQEREFVPGLTETEFLYDIGRSQSTPFDPKSASDTYYQRRQNKDLDPKKGSMRLGPYVTSAGAIGVGSWETPYSKPQFGTVSPTKNFNDKSHLSVPGF